MMARFSCLTYARRPVCRSSRRRHADVAVLADVPFLDLVQLQRPAPRGHKPNHSGNLKKETCRNRNAEAARSAPTSIRRIMQEIIGEFKKLYHDEKGPVTVFLIYLSSRKMKSLPS